MGLISKPSQMVEAAELLARLAKAEQLAHEESEMTHDEVQRRFLAGEVAGLQHAARLTRELADWPVEAESERT